MEQVSLELSEPNPYAGAFCQDYDSFVGIYRFVERRLQRVQSSVYSLLFTLADEHGDFPDLPERILLMEELHTIIQMSLRAGDVFTRYSSCQYLLMVLSTSGENAVKIGERIRRSFNKVVSYQYELKLNIDACPLQNSLL